MKKKLWGLSILMLGLFVFLGTTMQKKTMASEVVLDTNVAEATEGNVMLGVLGTFSSTEENEMLDLMNEVRKEAYDEHLEFPKNSGRYLGIDYTYKPLKWSNACENIARIRAAENSVYEEHERPSGEAMSLVFNGFSANGEVIAWNDTVLNAICNKDSYTDQGSWYSEKQYYLNPDGVHGTGHYEAMIDPYNRYVGISAFKGDYSTSLYGKYLSVVGEFSQRTSGLDETFVGLKGKYIQKIEVSAKYVTLNIEGENVLRLNESQNLSVNATVNIGSDGAYNCDVFSDVVWSSDDTSVATVNPQTGKITANNYGTTTVKASIDTGKGVVEAVTTVAVLPDDVEVIGLEAPEEITVNVGTKPTMPQTVKANLSNGTQIYVNVKWDSIKSDYNSKDSYNYVWGDTSFDVNGTFGELTVKQRVNVICQIYRIVMDKTEVTTDSGVKPVYPKITEISLVNGMGYSNPNNYWVWVTNDEYKKREGGTFTIEGYCVFTKSKTASFTLKVNPATITGIEFESDGETITTESGVEPKYPKATVTWSNGDTSYEEIEWSNKTPSATYTDPDDISRKYMMRNGGEYTLTGTYNGQTTSVTIHVNSSTAAKAELAASEQTVKCGTRPELAETATVTWSNGDSSVEQIEWNSISEEDYNKLEGNDFTVQGTCCGKIVSTNVTVLPASIVSVDPLEMITTPERVNPTAKLPETAMVNWSNNTSSPVEIRWNSISSSKYASPGQFQAEGYITDMYGKDVKVTVVIKVEKKKLTGLTIKGGKLTSDTSYYSYDVSDIAGTLVASYDNEETEEVLITSQMISDFDADSTTSSQTITISYTDNGITKSVEAEIYLIKRTGIKISKVPDKLKYIEDECDKISIDGIKVIELLDDGTQRNISSESYSVDDFSGFNPNPSTFGEQTITLSLYGFSDTFTVSVKQKTLARLDIFRTPDKMTYVEGQSFIPDGIVIHGEYDNGKTYTISTDDVLFRINTVFDPDPTKSYLGDEVVIDTPGELEIFVLCQYEVRDEGDGRVYKSYRYQSFPVNVIPKVVEEIEIDKYPSKISLPQNDVNFSDYQFSDGVIKVTYNDGDVKYVDFSDTTITNFDITKVGDQTVTVSYGGKSTAFDTTVTVPVITKTYVTPPTKTGYAEGETLELDGAKIVFAYDNGLKEDLVVDPDSADIDVAFSDGSSITAPLSGSNKTLVISYKGTALKTEDNKDITIGISKRTGIRVTKAPSTTVYPEGTPLNKISLNGIQLVAVFENGTTSPIPVKDYALADNDDYDPDSLGKQDIYVEAYDFEASFEITLREKRITAIDVESYPTKTEYVVGQPFSIDGLKVKASYDNETEGYISVDAGNVRVPGSNPFDISTYVPFTTDKTTSSAAGVLVYVVLPLDYDGNKTYVYDDACSIYVYEKEVQSIEITKKPSKLSLPQNLKNFDYSLFNDGQITAECNCDYVEKVNFSSKDVKLSGLDITKTGVQQLTVTYSGKTDTFDVEVTEPVVTSKTVTPPTKTSYSEGEAIVLTGASVVKTYDNGLTETIDLSKDAEALAKEGIKVLFVDEAGKEYAVNDPKVTTTPGAKTLVVKYRTSAEGEPEVYEEIKMPGGTSVTVDVKKKSEPVNPDDGKDNKGNGGKEGGKDSGNNGNTPKYSEEWINGKWYNADGTCTYDGMLLWKSNATGWWVEDTVGWYPTNSWQKIDGIWYYFNASGYMASGEYYNGYWFNSDGSWDPQYKLSWKSNATGWWVEDISGWWPSNSWLKVDGYWYYFDASGYMVTNQYVDGYWIGADGVCY